MAEMKRHKQEAVHIGGTGNYWLADLIDINRTYMENIIPYFESAKRLVASIEIGNILKTKQDYHSPPQNAEADYYDILENI